jgi:hypothetical protein
VPFTDCFLDHPCEATGGAVAAREDTNYGSPVSGLVECFNADGVFDLGRGGCGLDPGVQLTAQPQHIGAVNPDLATVPIGRPRPIWNVSLTGALPYYRYKVVAGGNGDCRNPFGYSNIRRVLDRPAIDDPLPGTDGPYLLCIMGGSDLHGEQWQRARHATAVVALVDHVPPRIPPPLTISGQSVNSYQVVFNTVPYEVSGYLFKFGRPADTRCADPEGYRPSLLPFISISTAQGPQVICAIAYDGAGNQAAPRGCSTDNGGARTANLESCSAPVCAHRGLAFGPSRPKTRKY